MEEVKLHSSTLSEQLFNNHDFTKNLLQHSSDIITVISEDGTILYQSPSTKRIFGRKNSELIGKNVFDFVHPEDIPSLKQLFTKIVAKPGVIPTIEFRASHKNGTWIPIEITGNNQLHNDKINGLIITSREITKRKEIEKALKESEERFSTILSKSPIPTAVTGSDGSIISFNKALETLTGYKKSEIRNVTEWANKLYPDNKYREFVNKNIKQALTGKKQNCTEFTITCKDGSKKIIDFRTSFFKDGLVIQMIDISDRVRTYNALQESEERFRSLAEKSPNMIFINMKGKIEYVNKKCEDVMGFKKEEFYDDTFDFMNIIAPEDRELLREKYSRHLAGQDVEPYEYSLLKKNGEKIAAIISTKLIDYMGEKAILGIVTDITERKEAEDLLKKTQTELERRVHERTLELAKVNKELQYEIKERKKAENDAIQTKDYLQNIINSASEIIISIDPNNKITTWNKTMEQLSGYKQREILGRNVNHLAVFENPKDFIANIKNQNIPIVHNLIINTKQETKKILQLSATEIQGKNQHPLGVLLIGKDVTYEIEAHGKLLSGNSYLITNKDNISPMDLFINLTLSKYKGLYITRTPPDSLFNITPPPEIKIKILQQPKSSHNISTLPEITSAIQQFTQKNKNSVIYLDRVDYLIINHTFKNFITELYQINDIITKNKSILLLYIDPNIIDSKELSLLQNELKDIPKQKIEDIEIKDELYDILHYIFDSNQKNTLVFFKKISKEFSTVSKTTAKRIKDLDTKGLIYIKKQGRLKTIHITEKGKALLHKRQII